MTEPATLRVAVDDHDAGPGLTKSLTVLALVGVAIASLMAVFGLPPVDLHTPLHHLGIMDPFCGGTRAARLTVRGDLSGAWTYNPLGIVAVVGAAVFLLRTTIGVATRRWVNLHVHLTVRHRRVLYAVGVVVLVALWIRQQARADLLIAAA